MRHKAEVGEEEWIKNIKHTNNKKTVVERTNSWHNRFRTLLVRYEKKSADYLAFAHTTSMLPNLI
jgi:transposase